METKTDNDYETNSVGYSFRASCDFHRMDSTIIIYWTTLDKKHVDQNEEQRENG